MKIVRWIAVALGLIAVVATLASLLPTDFWLVRQFDLLREMLTYLLVIAFVIAVLLPTQRRMLLAALFGLAICINVWRIWPYSSFAGTQVQYVADASDEQCFTAYSANVKMKNRDFATMISQIESHDPDIVFLTETDQQWVDALQPVIARYPHVRSHPQEDTFGKVFLSRIETVDIDVEEQAGEDTPTLYALLRASDRDLIRFTGLHPKAPLPGQNTDERDQSILRAAEKADGEIAGAIVMGDFNDVPWSRTTTAFRLDGDWLDPRIGRGTFPTFPSATLPIGWPLDQLMIKGDVKISEFEVLSSNGSDHRALLARLCLPRPINIENAP